MLEVQKAIAMRLPDGSHIKIETFDGKYADGNNRNRPWMSIDISRVWPDKKEVLLASVDYDESKGLRTLVFDKTHADPIFTKEDKL